MADESYEPISRTICFKLPDALYVEAKKQARAQDMLFGAWMRQAVEKRCQPCQCGGGKNKKGSVSK